MAQALGIFRGKNLGLALALAASVVPHTVRAAEFRVLHEFNGSDGAVPYSRLIVDKAGNLYGTTQEGGDRTACSGGCGTIFKLAPDGTETVLYAFQGGSDGNWPDAGVIADTAGNLYGTTSEGGGTGCQNSLGCGTVFKLAADGTLTVLHTFTGGNDGANPVAGLMADAAGNLYGTTINGGTDSSCDGNTGCGAVFKLAADGTETVLYAFLGGSDGANPQGAVIADKAGNLYGTTRNGGANDDGTVYKLAADGSESILYSFKGNADGNWPYGDLSMDKAGNLYGTTLYGGAFLVGTVFRIAPDGTETLLHSFNPDTTEGYNPMAGVILDEAGNLYGTTANGGDTRACMGGCGTIFKFAPDGTYTVLHALVGKQGAFPGASLLLAPGHLYGTASGFGKRHCKGCGTVFELAR